jgi:hypothetical protein
MAKKRKQAAPTQAQAPANPKGNGQPKAETGETTAGYSR